MHTQLKQFLNWNGAYNGTTVGTKRTYACPCCRSGSRCYWWVSHWTHTGQY